MHSRPFSSIMRAERVTASLCSPIASSSYRKRYHSGSLARRFCGSWKIPLENFRGWQSKHLFNQRNVTLARHFEDGATHAVNGATARGEVRRWSDGRAKARGLVKDSFTPRLS